MRILMSIVCAWLVSTLALAGAGELPGRELSKESATLVTGAACAGLGGSDSVCGLPHRIDGQGTAVIRRFKVDGNNANSTVINCSCDNFQYYVTAKSGCNAGVNAEIGVPIDPTP